MEFIEKTEVSDEVINLLNDFDERGQFITDNHLRLAVLVSAQKLGFIYKKKFPDFINTFQYEITDKGRHALNQFNKITMSLVTGETLARIGDPGTRLTIINTEDPEKIKFVYTLLNGEVNYCIPPTVYTSRETSLLDGFERVAPRQRPVFWSTIDPDNLPKGECLALNKARETMIGKIQMSIFTDGRKNEPGCYNEERDMYELTHYITTETLKSAVYPF